MNLKLTEELWREGNLVVSFCPELDIASCGETVAQAKKNLTEVILINLEEAMDLAKEIYRFTRFSFSSGGVNAW